MRDPARKQALHKRKFEQDMVPQAPHLITFCADWHRTREWLKARGARDNFNNLIGHHVAAFDAMLLSQSVCLGFEAHGLGICYMGTTLHSMREISELLALPETCLPVTTIVVGYPNEDLPKRDRLPLHGLMHDEQYRPLKAEAIDAIFAQREFAGWNRYLSMPRLKALIEEHGIRSLAEFYASKVKYDPATFLRDSEKLRGLLEVKRFLPRGGKKSKAQYWRGVWGESGWGGSPVLGFVPSRRRNWSPSTTHAMLPTPSGQTRRS